MERDPLLIVRRVMPVDLRATAEILTEQLRKRGHSLDVDRVRDAAQAALEDPRVLVVGAYHEGQPGFAHGKMVGVLMMNVLLSVEHLGEVGWIETLFVRESYRQKGLATRMLEETLAWGRARGLRRLDVEIGEEHETEAANHLYRKRGFELARRSRLTLQLG